MKILDFMVNLPYNGSMLFPEYTYTARIALIGLLKRRATASENDRPKINLAINLLRFRQDGKKSQSEVARALGVDQKNLSQWERGECAPSLRYLIALAKYFGKSVDELLTQFEIAE